MFRQKRQSFVSAGLKPGTRTFLEPISCSFVRQKCFRNFGGQICNLRLWCPSIQRALICHVVLERLKSHYHLQGHVTLESAVKYLLITLLCCIFARWARRNFYLFKRVAFIGKVFHLVVLAMLLLSTRNFVWYDIETFNEFAENYDIPKNTESDSHFFI